jgi:hypothetical protein
LGSFTSYNRGWCANASDTVNAGTVGISGFCATSSSGAFGLGGATNFPFPSEQCHDWRFGYNDNVGSACVKDPCGRDINDVNNTCGECQSRSVIVGGTTYKCGWCDETKTCIKAASSSGSQPYAQHCSSEGWYGPSDTCPTDACSSSTTCDACSDASSSNNCGWCATTKTCLTGSKSGPAQGTCPKSSWTLLTSYTASCPYDSCRSSSGCNACVTNSLGCGRCLLFGYTDCRSMTDYDCVGQGGLWVATTGNVSACASSSPSSSSSSSSGGTVMSSTASNNNSSDISDAYSKFGAVNVIILMIAPLLLLHLIK